VAPTRGRGGRVFVSAYAGAVSTPRDDDALSWGDDDPTLVTGGSDTAQAPARDAGSETLPEGWNAVGRGSDGDGHVAPVSDADPVGADDEDARPAAGSAALVAAGVLGGIYLLYAIGWLIGGLRLQGRYQVLVTDAMYQGALWVATAAPLIWFGTVLFATRGSRAWVRGLWLVAGALLLVPWPFIMIGAVGA
jgi:hypothetical protein